MPETPRPRPRPSPELMASLRDGKAALRDRRAKMPLREKLRLVLELQRISLPLIKRQRRLAAWERPWPVTP